MGFFSGVKDIYKKSEAAVLVQNLLEHQARIGLLSADPAKLANHLVEVVWQVRPDLFSGKFGQRPHKLSVAASALAFPLRHLKNGAVERDALILSLATLLSELNVNGRLYALNSLDETLLEEAVATFAHVTKEHRVTVPLVRESIACAYSSFEEWYAAYKAAAGAVNPQLMSENNMSLIDFMDHEPLRRAFRDGVEPRALAREFAESFDIRTFGR